MYVLIKYLLWYFVFNLNIYFVFTANSCERQTTCGDCIRDPSVCVWCADNDDIEPRCKSRDSISKGWCPGQLQDPKSSARPTASGNRDFSSESGNVIQIKPQSYKIQARRGEPVDFSFIFKGIKDYPVDLYFLMDASSTMKKMKDETARQSEKIYLTMKAFTNDVHLGMGSFVDKNVFPFAYRTTNSNLTYSFKHRLKLTKDIKQFQNTVSATTFGVNRDNPEGGLDALAQVIVCKDIIGWRLESRKIVVLLTDGPYHAAGDGRNAGIFEPYDGKCYTENGVYTKETVIDYPSLAMVNKLATENEVIVIFFVNSKYDTIYRDLSSVISGSKTANYDESTIKQNEAIVKILKDVYEEITKRIKLKVDIKGENRKNVHISFNPDCNNQQGNDCEVKKDEEQKFLGTLKVNEVGKFSVEVTIEGISEKLSLDVEVIEDCECEKFVEKSRYCHGESRSCGICKCGNERYGDRCMCVRNENNPYNDNSTCLTEGSAELCSGRGSCLCGTCQCRERYEGKYCQCNKDSCPRNLINGNICNGEDHGKCDCGSCLCNSKWSGKACECSTSQVDCISRNGKICNNRGSCNCGICSCEPLAEWDKRRQQDSVCNVEPCPECHSFQCRHLDSIALCHRNSQGCVDDSIIVQTVETLNSSHVNSTEWNLCPDIKVDIGCYTRYVYKYDDKNYEILMVLQNEKDCIESYLVFGGLFFLALIIIGLITLIAWKILTEARDKMEYEKFVKQQKECMSGPVTNPLYKPTTTTFRNPAFRKGSIH